jgi:lipopolysaccharide transport system permease protein
MSLGLGAATDAEAGEGTRHAVLHERRIGPWTLVREAWQDRAIVPYVGIRQIVKGYAGTILGRTWLVLRPLMGILMQALVFGAVLSAPSNGKPYILFLLVGMLAWMSFMRVSFLSLRSFNMTRKLYGKLRFSPVLVIVGSTVMYAIEFAVLSVFWLVLVAFFWFSDGTLYLELDPGLALAPVGLALCVLLAWSVDLWLVPLNDKARDVRIVFRYALMVWMYVTPVLYPLSALPGVLDFLAKINPVTAPVEMVKYAVLDAGTVHLTSLVSTIATLVVVGGSGLWFFGRMQPGLLRDQPGFFDDEEEDEELAGGVR